MNTLEWDPTAIDFLTAIDITSDDSTVGLSGGTNHVTAFWALIDAASLTVITQLSIPGLLAVDGKFIIGSDTDYIIVISTEGAFPFTETYQYYSGATLVWTLDLICDDCLAPVGFVGLPNSRIVLIDGGNFATFWCPNSVGGECALLIANQVTGAVVSLSYITHTAGTYENWSNAD